MKLDKNSYTDIFLNSKECAEYMLMHMTKTFCTIDYEGTFLYNTKCYDYITPIKQGLSYIENDIENYLINFFKNEDCKFNSCLYLCSDWINVKSNGIINGSDSVTCSIKSQSKCNYVLRIYNQSSLLGSLK